ncbi:MAG: bifunctional methylenetetrahydrofolate dehydrogenase/methenyltetrahydrofolate cyclohydrolase [Proteobacteria bacterium]|nr:bifunctional methylenetetrahydrofolate dehydrogenase/methenyltetrahydrofolate cyclohydrolase [Pseudomonadota bacterium]NCA28436.1 bifunctional methylenetetrahydrofolate dehydrogenase/methenyltetrahydrofolate cyclohydrolase [Pseudomonadota bacterium]
MTAQIINGKEISMSLRKDIASRVDEIKKKFHLTPTLAVILVGNDPASEVYVSNKEKSAHAVGMNSIQFKMSGDISEAELITKIEELNNDKKVHGILVQLPLPKHIDAKKVIHKIDYKKDVDGFHVINVGKLSIGEVEGVEKAMIPCTPLGCIHLLKSVKGNDLAGLKTLVIGTSNIVGRPLTRLLLLEGCTVTVANRSTKDLKSECLQSDVIFSATGVPNLIRGDMVKKGSVIIDVGINRILDHDEKYKIVGDVNFDEVKNIASAITPVPGGVGPMTIAYLLQNTLDCYLKLLSKN